ncbi:MAG: hypothetical protein ACTSRF_16440 [Candidatus Freyarchaeota archaeon]
MALSIGLMFIVLFGFLVCLSALIFYFFNWSSAILGVDTSTLLITSLNHGGALDEPVLFETG